MVHRPKYKDRHGVQRESKRYYAQISLPWTGQVRVAGFPQERATAVLEAAMETLYSLKTEGRSPDQALRKYLAQLPERITAKLVQFQLISPAEGGGRARTLEAALSEFESHLLAKGSTAGHASSQRGRVGRVLVELCGYKMLAEIRSEAVLRALADLRGRGLSATTSNAYRQACRAFTKWATRERLLSEDPLLYLDPVKAESDSGRRVLTAEEQVRLVATTRGEPRRGRMSGPERSVLYLLAIQTGLRRSELLSLRRSSLVLGGVNPCLVVEARHTKNRKTARLPLQASTVALLQEFVKDRLPAAPLFRASKHFRAAEVLKLDLEAAGIEPVTDAGRVDFHALRVTFVTNLALAQVSLAQAQKLARHCDPKLTANIYSRFGFDEDAAAIARLPGLADSAG